MPTLAHEGNPKEDTITIGAGDVLSTATLSISALVFGGEPTPPVAEPSAEEGDYTCSWVFDWPNKVVDSQVVGQGTGTSGVDFMNLSNSPCLSTGGVQTRLADTTLDLTINSTPECYGIIWVKISSLASNPANQPAAGAVLSFRASFAGLVEGTPRAGICIWVHDDTTHAIAYCYALVLDYDVGYMRLLKYDGTSLGSVANATELGTLSLPAIGDILYLEMDQILFDAGGGTNGIYASLYDSGLNLKETTFSAFEEDLATGEAVRHAKCGVGFVSIGGNTEGILKFKHSADTSCQNGLTPFVTMQNYNGF